MAPIKEKKPWYIGYQGPSSLNVPLPSKIKCSRCNVIKNVNSFAKTRLADIQTRIANNPRFNPVARGIIPCSECTGVQHLEHDCAECGKTKGTDTGFSKVQLKRGEDAICIKCSEQHNALGVKGEDDDSDDSRSSNDSDKDSDEDDDDYSDGGWTAAGWGDEASSNAVSGAGTGTTTQNSNAGSTFPSHNRGSGGGVLLSSQASSVVGAAHSSSSGSTIIKTATNLPSGFNPNRYGRPVAAVARPKPEEPALRKGNPGFAKIRAVPPPKPVKKQRNGKKKQESSEDEDEDQIVFSDSD